MKVFVSSTTKDLGETRERVCEQLLQLDLQPSSMDSYTSGPEPPKERDDAEVQKCAGFIIIVGHLYGSSPVEGGKSYTELEYETAKESGMDIYPFLASEKFPFPSIREDDATFKKLQAFKKRLEKDHTPRYFNNIDKLCAEVAATVPRLVEQERRIIVPKLPKPYLVHPYPLQENFTGRLKERAMLTEWVREADSRPMLSLVGMGGLGKSALSWYWLHEDLPQENLRFTGILWWSFYESGASFESFLSHALLYASGDTIDPSQLPSDYDRIQSLWCILKDDPFLLIFDGVERLLRAYHALDAAYKGDDFSVEARERHLLCADPRAGALLQALADPWLKTRTLLTTRLHPKELDGLAGCRKEDLKRLEPDDAVEFMRRQGIKGSRNAIVHACEPYDFLPLCLRLLSGAIRKASKKRGDIKASDGWHPPRHLVRRKHHILHVAYDTMAKDRRVLLSRIATLRGSVDYDTVKVLSRYKIENKLDDALEELEDRGLLFRQKDSDHYDLHPIVRQYAYDRLGNKAATHDVLKNYFDTVPQPDKIESLDDLMPTIELFHHTINSGGYEEALEVYRSRLARPLYFQLGTYDVDISLKQAFFPDGVDQPASLGDKLDQAWILNDLGMAYSLTGQDRKAVSLVERSIDIWEKEGSKQAVAVGLGALGNYLMPLGELKDAQSNRRREIAISKEIHEQWGEAIGHKELGLLLTYMGRYDQADKELETALRMNAKQYHRQGQCLSWSYRVLRALLMDEPKSALKALRKARQFWKLRAMGTGPVERDLIRILWLSGAAKRCASDTSGAEADLNEALSRCRRIRLVEFEADILLEMAKLQWEKAQDIKQKSEKEELVDQAKTLISEALEIADRCEYRLKQADIHNFLAEMAFAEDDTPAALKHAEIAKERAWCDGPSYCYKKALDDAEQMLAKLA